MRTIFTISILFFSTFVLKAQVTDVVTGLNFPQGMAIYNNEMYIAEFGGNQISKFNLSDPNPTVEVVVTGLNGPDALVVSGNYLFIAEYYGDKISKIDLTDTNPSPITVVDIVAPQALAVKDGNLYISNFSLYKIDINAANPVLTDVVPYINDPAMGLVIKDDLLYVSGYYGKVNKIDLSVSNPTAVEVVSGLSGYLTGLEILGNNLFVAELNTSKISKIDISEVNPSPIDFLTINSPHELRQFDNYLYISLPNVGTISKIENTLGTDDVSLESISSIYPNPSNGSFIVKLNTSYASVVVNIYDLLGKTIFSENFFNKRTMQVTADLNPGIYLVKIEAEGKEAVKQLIIR